MVENYLELTAQIEIEQHILYVQIESIMGLQYRPRNPRPKVKDNDGNEAFHVSYIIH